MGYPIPLSNSRLENAGCLYKFFRLYVADPKVQIPKTVPMGLGGMFHEVLDAYHRALAPDPRRQAVSISDINLMGQVFDRVWRDERPEEFAFLGEEHYQPLLNLCMDWAPRYPVGPEFVGSEVRMALNQEWGQCGWMSKDVRYRMVMDRVDIQGRSVWVRDWKTSWAAPSENAAKNDPQMQGYGLGIAAVIPEAEIITVALVYPRLQLERTAVIEKADIKKAVDRIERESSRIERARASGKWEAIPGEQCAFCPVWKECPEMKAAAEFRAPDSEEDARTLLGKWALMKKQQDDLVGHMKAWVKMCGPVARDGLVAENRPTATTVYDDAFRDTLESAGVDIYQLMKWDAKALTKAAKQIPDVRDALGDYTHEVTKGTRWHIGREGQEAREEQE